jgi:hypothetical protein
VENIGQIALAASRRYSCDVEKVLWTTSWYQGTCIDQSFSRTCCSLYRDESGDEPSVIGDAEFLASFDPGEVP